MGWSATQGHWPADVLNQPTEESQVEGKLMKKFLAIAVEDKNEIEEVLHKFQLWRAKRVWAWMRRFGNNSFVAQEFLALWDCWPLKKQTAREWFGRDGPRGVTVATLRKITWGWIYSQISGGYWSAEAPYRGSIQFICLTTACLDPNSQKKHTSKRCMEGWG